jgi:hypothetical protein
LEKLVAARSAALRAQLNAVMQRRLQKDQRWKCEPLRRRYVLESECSVNSSKCKLSWNNFIGGLTTDDWVWDVRKVGDPVSLQHIKAQIGTERMTEREPDITEANIQVSTNEEK